MRHASSLYRLGITQRAMIAALCIAIVWLATLTVIAS